MIKISEDKTIITCDGVLKSCYTKTKTDENGYKTTKNCITFTPKDGKKVFDAIETYKDSGKKFTPEWFKNGVDIILRSIYDIPFQTPEGEQLSFDDFCERGLIKDADVVVRFKQKLGEESGAVYPMAVKVTKDGNPFNPFEDM